MTSLTRIAYGSRVLRQGRSRPCSPNQARSSSSTPRSLEERLSARKQENGQHRANLVRPRRGGRNRHSSSRAPQVRLVDGELLRIPIAEAARRLGCSVETLKRRGADGRLEIVKDGSRLYVPEAFCVAWPGRLSPPLSGSTMSGWTRTRSRVWRI